METASKAPLAHMATFLETVGPAGCERTHSRCSSMLAKRGAGVSEKVLVCAFSRNACAYRRALPLWFNPPNTLAAALTKNLVRIRS